MTIRTTAACGLLTTLLASTALASPEPPPPPESGFEPAVGISHFTVATPGMPMAVGDVTTSTAEFLAAALNVMGRLFPPSLIMRKQQDIALSPSQAEAIKTEMRNFQGKVVDIQWDLNERQARLDGLLEAEQIDAPAAESAIDAVLVHPLEAPPAINDEFRSED